MISDNGLNQGIFRLFLLFSRLEYALTRSRGFVIGEPGRAARGNWQEFAVRLGQDFFDDLRADPTTSKPWEEPPGQWIVSKDGNGDLTSTWQARVASPELQRAFEPIMWVRNCVVHGESQDMVVRYMELVEASIKVLSTAVERCINVPELREVVAMFNQARAQET